MWCGYTLEKEAASTPIDIITMDLIKIYNVADQQIIDYDSIFRLYSHEIMKIIVDYECPPKNVRRCSRSDMMVDQGFNPAEALFLLEWIDIKKVWIEYEYTNLTIDDQFARLYRYLYSIDSSYSPNGTLFANICKLCRIYRKSEYIDRVYSSWVIYDRYRSYIDTCTYSI
jgi:hypothetical protein